MSVSPMNMKKPISQRFEEMNRLYHFTTLDAAFKIVESGQLKFGKPFRMNDIIESNRIVFQRTFLRDMSKDKGNGLFAEEEMRRYQQVSFSQDKKYDGKIVLGFDLHTMWGLYAERGAGVCLVFDKDKLNIEGRDYAKDIEYYDYIPSSFAFKNRSKAGIKSEIWRRKDEIFFIKRKEWESEQEFRIIRRASNEMDDDYLNISNSLSFAIIISDDSCLRPAFRYKNKRIPLLSYENGLDGYSLYESRMDDPIWTEEFGFM